MFKNSKTEYQKPAILAHTFFPIVLSNFGHQILIHISAFMNSLILLILQFKTVFKKWIYPKMDAKKNLE